MILPIVLGLVALWGLMPGSDNDDGPTAPPVGWAMKNGVVLNDRIRAFLDLLYQTSGVPFVVTSGVRTARAQAAAMLTKIEQGADLYGTYKASLRDFISAIYQAAPDVAEMTAVVEDFLSRGIVPSRHLLGDAVDIRIKDLDESAIARLDAAGRSLGATTLREGSPPCLHMQEIPLPLLT